MQLYSDDLIFIPNYFFCSLFNYAASDADLSFPQDTTAPGGSGPPHHRSFTTQVKQTTLSRTPLDE
jgi:hypothetical protein